VRIRTQATKIEVVRSLLLFCVALTTWSCESHFPLHEVRWDFSMTRDARTAGVRAFGDRSPMRGDLLLQYGDVAPTWLKLPGGKIYEGQPPILLCRLYNEQIQTIQIYSHDKTTDDAYAEARRLAQYWKLDQQRIDSWYSHQRRALEEDTSEAVTLTTKETMPEVYLNLVPSFNDSQPWTVILAFQWRNEGQSSSSFTLLKEDEKISPPVLTSFQFSVRDRLHKKRIQPPSQEKPNGVRDIFQVRVGMAVRTSAEASFSDGSWRDVLKDSTAVFASSAETIAVFSSGTVQFLSTGEQSTTMVSITATYHGQTRTLHFEVFPALLKEPPIVALYLRMESPIAKQETETTDPSPRREIEVDAESQFRVHAETIFADGQRQDVTTDPATLLFITKRVLANVSPNGKVTVFSPESALRPFFEVGGSYGEGKFPLLSFRVKEKESLSQPPP
jgi:hypothetical protein